MITMKNIYDEELFLVGEMERLQEISLSSNNLNSVCGRPTDILAVNWII